MTTTAFDWREHATKVPRVTRSSNPDYAMIADFTELNLMSELNRLLRKAHDLGFVVTVDLEQIGTIPAMGNYRMVGHVRGIR